MTEADAAQTVIVALEGGVSAGMTIRAREAGAPIVLIAPAMGVEAAYYDKLALALAEEGLNVAVADMRGLGTSSIRARRGVDFGYREIVEVDLPAIAAAARGALGGGPLFLLGHSLGGQLGCLFASRAEPPLAGLILIACCSVYWRAWEPPLGAGIFAFQRVAEATSALMGYFPGHVFRFGGQEARRMTRDWASQGRTGAYRPEGSRVDYEAAMRQGRTPVLAISFTDDWYAPEAAVRHLLDKMPAADRTHLHLSPWMLGTDKLGHFPWARRPEAILPILTPWIDDRR